MQQCHAAYRREQHPIERPQPRTASLPTKDPELMTQHEDLQILRADVCAPAGEHSSDGSDHQGEQEQHRGMLRMRWSGRELSFRSRHAGSRRATASSVFSVATRTTAELLIDLEEDRALGPEMARWLRDSIYRERD
jgi:hypothetical protein